MAVFCWGSTINGELGTGGVEEEHVIKQHNNSIIVKSTLVKEPKKKKKLNFFSLKLLDNNTA